MEALADKRRSPHQRSAGSAPGKSPASTHKALITRNLRLAYGEVASEPVPQRLLDLLQRLGDAEGKKS
jgi:hypothetical protein